MATYKKSEAKRLGKVWVRLVRGKKTLESLLIARSKLKGIVADLDQCPCRVKGDLIKIYDPKTHNTLTLKWKR